MSLTLSFVCIKLLTALLRHVQGFPLLGLLRELRYHVGYSEPIIHSLSASRFR